MRTDRVAILWLVAAAAAGPGAVWTPAPGGGAWGVARAGEAPDWRKEFEDVCSKTQDAMTLGTDELRALVRRCDELEPILDKLEESARKVYTRRLRACRDLYQFVLDARAKG